MVDGKPVIPGMKLSKEKCAQVNAIERIGAGMGGAQYKSSTDRATESRYRVILSL
ncbi:putative membrane-associated lysozyme; Qin prophage [Escherichia coli]|uniref:Putative membrane-associated lysozyme Qin prophage n=1 Tax=Escherichia coli TaxID=562 RepID=A0A376VJD2_ECOLX|nr:putative membrane-associated lysozyme; Qin prophage [Escherichia coli]